MGISGSGKSTLLHILAGFDTPTSGSILFDQKPIDLFSVAQKEQYLQRTIGFIFQQPYLIKELSILENIMLPALIAGIGDADARERALELINLIKLHEYANYRPGILSGGQQQLVALARALCNKPAFLCADEPTANVDTHNRTEMIALIKHGVAAWNMGVIVCTHDPVVAEAMERILHLREGKIFTHR